MRCCWLATYLIFFLTFVNANQLAKNNVVSYFNAQQLDNHQLVNGTVSAENGSSPAQYYYFDVTSQVNKITAIARVVSSQIEGGTFTIYIAHNQVLRADSADQAAMLRDRCQSFSTSGESYTNGVPSSREYLCWSKTFTPVSFHTAAQSISLSLPRSGRYYLTALAQSGDAQFEIGLTLDFCSFESAGQPCTDIHRLRNAAAPTHDVAEPDSTKLYFFNIEQQQQPTNAFLAFSVHFQTDCDAFEPTQNTGGLYIRYGGAVKNSDFTSPDAYDTKILCGDANKPSNDNNWIMPASGSYFFLVVGGESKSFNYTLSVQNVPSGQFCPSSHSGGASCNATLDSVLPIGEARVLCPFHNTVTCIGQMNPLKIAHAYDNHIPIDFWHFYYLDLDASYYNVQFQLSKSAQALSDADTTWWMLVQKGAVPQFNWEYKKDPTTLFPHSASIDTSREKETNQISVDMSYTSTGRYYVAVYRRLLPSTAKRADLSEIDYTLYVTTTNCPNSCSGNGACTKDNHCECKNVDSVHYDDLPSCFRSEPIHHLNDGGDGLAVGLGITIPLLLAMIVSIVVYVIWKEKSYSNY